MPGASSPKSSGQEGPSPTWPGSTGPGCQQAAPRTPVRSMGQSHQNSDGQNTVIESSHAGPGPGSSVPSRAVHAGPSIVGASAGSEARRCRRNQPWGRGASAPVLPGGGGCDRPGRRRAGRGGVGRAQESFGEGDHTCGCPSGPLAPRGGWEWNEAPDRAGQAGRGLHVTDDRRGWFKRPGAYFPWGKPGRERGRGGPAAQRPPRRLCDSLIRSLSAAGCSGKAGFPGAPRARTCAGRWRGNRTGRVGAHGPPGSWGAGVSDEEPGREWGDSQGSEADGGMDWRGGGAAGSTRWVWLGLDISSSRLAGAWGFQRWPGA